LGMLEERVAPLVQMALALRDQRRHPVVRALIQPPRQPDEGAQIALSPHRADLHGSCARARGGRGSLSHSDRLLYPRIVQPPTSKLKTTPPLRSATMTEANSAHWRGAIGAV